jgi:dTDP-4-amino-4,6-dideoxygalactose transaminase
MRNIPLVDLKAQYDSIKSEIDDAIHSILDATRFIGGQPLTDFEADFRKYQQTKHCIGVASGTAAIFLVLRALDIKAGDEIITTPHTFIATVEPIEEVGAIPIFVDINSQNYNIDPQRIEDAITPKTRAIMPVHLYGQIAPMQDIMDIAKHHNLHVIEDSAQAHGAEYKGKRSGAWGDAAVFSFYPGKNLGAYGDAGAICTNNDELAKTVAALRDHGRTSKYEHSIIGYGERMDSIQAAILKTKLAHLEDWTQARRRLAQYYTEHLSNVEGITTPHIMNDSNPAWHVYCIRVAGNRDEILARLKERGIGVGVHYPLPLHLQPALKHRGYGQGAMPITEAVAQNIISLPIYPELSTDDADYIIDSLTEIIENRKQLV